MQRIVRDDTASPECRDARSKARSAASELASSSKRLTRCAEAEDFSDECDSEFRRAKRDHDDYERAVSDVGSACG
ncbi:MAG: putative integron cassette protein [Ramlibacter sp.]|nr:putative integron cassette protein [Ramlibacter sp.]